MNLKPSENGLNISDEEKTFMKQLQLVTAKPFIYVANLSAGLAFTILTMGLVRPLGPKHAFAC